MISRLVLDTPNDKGVSKRQHLNKVYEQSGVCPSELEEEVIPELNDEPLFNTFFDIFQREKEFYQTIYYYQQVIGIEFDGEDLAVLSVLWSTASKYLADQDKKKRASQQKKSGKGVRKR